jgi:hypothetical protein
VLTTRQGYQFAMASQTVTVNSPGFQMVMGRARAFASVEHLSTVVMQKLSFAMIYGQVAQIAAVRAIDDTFFVASVICIPAILVALIVRNTKAASGAGPRPVLSE